jgi:hypothetical protein
VGATARAAVVQAPETAPRFDQRRGRFQGWDFPCPLSDNATVARDATVQPGGAFVMKSRAFCFALLSVIGIVAGAPANAQNGSLTRSFVSSAGLDTNACTIAAPCATFAVAYTKISANGIIAALDPGKYGPIAITGPVTINGNGWAAITAPAAGNGITITAGSGNVTLTGLEIDGAGAAYNGIVFNSGGKLIIGNCIVKDTVLGSNGTETTGTGIVIQPSAGTVEFTITNTTVTNNGDAGIFYLPPSGSPSVSGVIDHLVATGNFSGILISEYNASGGSLNVVITSSILNNNNFGVQIGGVQQGNEATDTVTLDTDDISNNDYGLSIEDGTAIVSNSVIVNNSTYGIDNSATIYTYQNNRYLLNGNNNALGGTQPIVASPK